MKKFITLLFFLLVSAGANAQTPVLNYCPTGTNSSAPCGGTTMPMQAAQTGPFSVTGTQLFYDAFDYGTLVNWQTKTSGGSASAVVGTATVTSGTTSGQYGAMVSNKVFTPSNPGWVVFRKNLQFTYPVVTNTYQAWGLGTLPTSPTVGTPLSDSANFAIQPATGHLFVEMWQSGVGRSLSIDLTTVACAFPTAVVTTAIGCMPTDGATHKYDIYYKADNVYFVIEGLTVYTTLNGGPGPNVNTLPVMLMSMATGATAGASLNLAAAYVSDTGRNQQMLPDAVNFNNGVLANGTIQAGLFSSGTVTNLILNQVILGPIDTTGTNSFVFTLSTVSGSGASISIQEAPTQTGPWQAVNFQIVGSTQANLASTTSAASEISGPVKMKYIQAISNGSATIVFTMQGYLRQSVFVPSLSVPGFGIFPSSSSSFGVTPVVSGSAEATHVLKNAPGNLYSAYATNLTSTAGFLVVLNATSAPGDGAIAPLECVPLPANGNASINYNPGPLDVFSVGITAVLTSANTCFTKTTGVITGYIKGSVQ